MPFTKLDVKNEINKKKMESKTFEKAWNESQEEYELKMVKKAPSTTNHTL